MTCYERITTRKRLDTMWDVFGRWGEDDPEPIGYVVFEEGEGFHAHLGHSGNAYGFCGVLATRNEAIQMVRTEHNRRDRALTNSGGAQ